MVFTFDDDVWSAVFKIQCAFPNMDRRACLNERLYIHLSMKLEENRDYVTCSWGVNSESRADVQIGKFHCFY